MTALEEQLTKALRRLSAQYETEQRRHSGQVESLRRHVEALRGRVERQSAENEALRQHVERLSGENEALQMRIERLDGQVTRLAECYGTLAATLC
ncbi:hypothetical protein [Candidatus Palauibacter sp.]|uniref:hypothetical protein n=1 Tax=Candidatus Palauibacter sp. TaxID=3101350 RepID=UPI003AF2C799